MFDSSMPSGVEHVRGLQGILSGIGVFDSSMPSGVEHKQTTAGTMTGLTVFDSSMPSGVEHAMNWQIWQTFGGGVRLFDAVRR